MPTGTTMWVCPRPPVEVSPNSFKSHRLLAAALYEAGGEANVDRAIAGADRALAILSALPDARSNPEAWRRAGDYYAAKGDLLRACGSDPAPAYRKSRTLLLRVRAVVNANYDVMAADARARGGIVPERSGSRIADLEAAISAAYLNVGDAAGAYTAASVAAQLARSVAEATVSSRPRCWPEDGPTKRRWHSPRVGW
jgi:hypothetical protein